MGYSPFGYLDGYHPTKQPQFFFDKEQPRSLLRGCNYIPYTNAIFKARLGAQ